MAFVGGVDRPPGQSEQSFILRQIGSGTICHVEQARAPQLMSAVLFFVTGITGNNSALRL
jgi:hypothetical protein